MGADTSGTTKDDKMDPRDVHLYSILSTIHKDLPVLALTKLSPLMEKGYPFWALEGMVIITLPLLMEELETRPSTSPINHRAD